MVKAYKIIVSGKVQGVFYRASTCEYAKKLSIKGTVKNTANGSVEIVAEGHASDLDELIKWCKKGPQWAVVKEVQFEEIQIQGYKTFETIR